MTRRGVHIVSGAEVEPVAIEWYWQGWLAAGKFELLAGAKGSGKSSVLIDLLARATNPDAKWPDGEKVTKPGNVLIWSSEDDFADTILPRFLAAGGVRERLYYIKGFDIGNGRERPFDPANDMPELIKALEGIPDLRCIMIDPVVMAVAGDEHRNSTTRRGLQPLVDLAQRFGTTVIGITHFNKGSGGEVPIERINGSLAYGALPRVVLGTGGTEEGSRRLVRIASNIGPSGGGFEYSLAQAPVPDRPSLMAQGVFWSARLSGSAGKLLAPEPTSELEAAAQWLKSALAKGPAEVKDLQGEARAKGHAWRTVERAKKDLLIKAEHIEGTQEWQWRLYDPLKEAA